MVKVRAPVAGFNGRRHGVVFAGSVGETSDAEALAWFRQRGYEVEGPEPAPEPAGKPLNKWRAAELHALAGELGIEGHAEMNKEPLLDAIQTHYAAREG